VLYCQRTAVYAAYVPLYCYIRTVPQAWVARSSQQPIWGSQNGLVPLLAPALMAVTLPLLSVLFYIVLCCAVLCCAVLCFYMAVLLLDAALAWPMVAPPAPHPHRFVLRFMAQPQKWSCQVIGRLTLPTYPATWTTCSMNFSRTP
jgi:hypothetical protein